MRLANQVDGPQQGRVDSAVTGVEVLTPRTVHAIATRARTFDFFERTAVWQGIPERFRLHAVATQRAADRLAREIGYEDRDRLMVTSLLHDIGKLVLDPRLSRLSRPGPRRCPHPGGAPAARAPRARRRPRPRRRRSRPPLGDAATIASVIERHHAEDTDGEAALVRLADMLAHYVLGGVGRPG